MKPKGLLSVVVGSAALALVALLGAADTAHATFNPSLEITVVDPAGGANSDITSDFNLPEGDVNFAGLVAFIPREWQITPGDEIPIGAVVGELTAQATLGLINGACNNVLPVQFVMLNSSIDPNDTVDFLDSDDNDTEDYLEDLNDNVLPDGFEKYPDFITRVLVDENDNPLTPIRRAAGITVVAGVNVLLQFLVFEPGTFINKLIPNDEALGYPTVTLLQNIGDPESPPVPSVITDFCTPLLSSNTTFGVTKDNGCTAAVPADELDPLCEISGVPLTEGDPTDPDEGGNVLFANPPEGTYTFTTVGVGQRDADGDGSENSLDTCPFDVNEGNPRIGGDGDADDDGLDAICDPNDNETNSDNDLPEPDGYTNRQDNCPTIANGENEADIPGVGNQEDNDVDVDGEDASDQIGDACDSNPDTPDGELVSVVLTEEVTITGGTAPPPTEDDEGGGGAVIFIIIGVIAGVVVVGGGALYFMRRRGGGAAV